MISRPPPTGATQMSASRRRPPRHHRRRDDRSFPLSLIPAALVLVMAVVAGVFAATGRLDGAFGGGPPAGAGPAANGEPGTADRSEAASRRAGGRPTATANPSVPHYPIVGPRTWHVAPGSERTLGSSGPILRFRVEVERGITGVTATEFASAVENTLGDRRGWTGTGQRRLRLVGPGQRADFAIFLATPATRDELCGGGYDRYTSCRNGDSVVINIARWAHGVPKYGASLATYRQYVVNHEVGHRFGYGHELCPKRGELAPVMQQQTLGLHGCTANAWPLRGGEPYHGRSGAYEDAVPGAS